MALILVLLIICITLGLSYAAVRSQFTGLKIQRNADRRISARQAAATGLTMAIKKMHTDDWKGVETTLTGSLGSDQGFQVTYSTGDPSLGPGDADYEDFPYRVTLLSTGSAADPDNPASVATHQIRAVVRLAPRQLGDRPSDWNTMQKYTVYQSHTGAFEMDIPCRIEGPVRVQDKLELTKHYPDDWDARTRYMRDLNEMQLEGRPDYRPLIGPVHLPHDKQDGECLVTLSSRLDATPVHTPAQEAASDWTKPTGLTEYQIYEGGPVYAIRQVGNTLANVTLEPHVEENPLGINYCDGTVTIGDGVTIRGSLFCREDIKIEGVSVRFEAVNLPALYRGEGPVRLPVASCRNFVVKPTAAASVEGLVAVFDHFQVDKSPETVSFNLTGRLITRKLLIKERQPWETLDWADLYVRFEDQHPTVPYFPDWMALQERDPEPLIRIGDDLSHLTALSGTGTISEASTSPSDTHCDISDPVLNTADPNLVPIGARFSVSTLGNSTVYTVTGRTPANSGPTESITFSPKWGSPTPDTNDTITLLPPPSDAETPSQYHWKNPYDPVYVRAPNDPNDPNDDGLHWELLEWTENP